MTSGDEWVNSSIEYPNNDGTTASKVQAHIYDSEGRIEYRVIFYDLDKGPGEFHTLYYYMNENNATEAASAWAMGTDWDYSIGHDEPLETGQTPHDHNLHLHDDDEETDYTIATATGTDTNGDPNYSILVPSLKTLIERTKLNKEGGDWETPFEIFNRHGDTTFKQKSIHQHKHDTWRVISSTSTIRLENHIKSVRDSSAVLIEIKEGYWVEANIMNENAHYFNTIAAPLSLDPNLINEDFDGADSDFTIKLYGGSIVWMDVDKEFAAGALSGSFYLKTGPDRAYGPVDTAANQEYQFKVMSWGKGADPEIEIPPPPPPGIDIVTDPFDLIDGMPSPFETTDDLLDRLAKSFVFGVNGSFRAVEAVVEGIMIALPALIVIGAAVIVAKLIINAAEKGTVKVVSMGSQLVKNENSIITSVKVPKFSVSMSDDLIGGGIDVG